MYVETVVTFDGGRLKLHINNYGENHHQYSTALPITSHTHDLTTHIEEIARKVVLGMIEEERKPQPQAQGRSAYEDPVDAIWTALVNSSTMSIKARAEAIYDYLDARGFKIVAKDAPPVGDHTF